MWLLDRLLRRAVVSGALEVRNANGKTYRYGDPAATPLRITLKGARTASKIGLNPALGAGEAYMAGDLLIGDGRQIEDLLDLIGYNLRWDRSNPLRVSLWNQQHWAARWDEWNAPARARRNVARHYDLSDQLYDLFLDPERQYSCAYFRPGNDGPDRDLDQAQLDKLAHITRKLRLQPGMRVLDIGCGWGGMARAIHRITGAEVLGITLSVEQHAYANAKAAELGIADKVTYELRDYRQQQGQFDRIVSVGMFEHVGRPNYRTYFEKVADLLKPDGVALIHTIGRAGGKGATDPWTAKYIFPGGYTPALSEILPHVERAYLWPADIEVWRLHYAYTLEIWLQRCRAKKREIIALYDETFYRMWEFYLAGARNAFRHDDHVVYQLQLTRERDAVPLARAYQYEG